MCITVLFVVRYMVCKIIMGALTIKMKFVKRDFKVTIQLPYRPLEITSC